MLAQQQADSLCRICASRPATTTQPFWSEDLPTCDSCTPFDLIFALAGDPMRQRRPPCYPQALYLATLAAVAAQEPAPLARQEDRDGGGPSRVDTFARDRAPGAEGGAEAFHACVRPDEAGRPGAADAFWRAALPEADRGKEASGHFTAAFADAALCVALMRPDVPRR